MLRCCYIECICKMKNNSCGKSNKNRNMPDYFANLLTKIGQAFIEIC